MVSQRDVKLQFDFEADVRQEYAAKLTQLGVPVAPRDTAEDLIVRFFSLSDRSIDAVPRRVAWSPEFQSRFHGLPTDYRTAITTIEQIATSGGDLNSYQSRDLAKAPWKPDAQLLEWGITHFHLGLAADRKYPGMVAGTADLLFVVVRAETVFFIDVLPHDSFSDQAAFDIAVKNWPALFDYAALSDNVVGLEYNPTTQERKELRQAGINVLTMGADGRVYAPVGGGRTTKGSSVRIVREYLLPRMGAIKAWERLCTEKPEQVLAMIPSAAWTGLSAIVLRASENDGAIVFSAMNVAGGPLALGSGYPPHQ